MKNLIKFIFLIFFIYPSISKANDIYDFEIDGISVGQSLLEILTLNKIKNAFNYDHLPSSMKFRIAEFENEIKSDTYDAFQIYYKPEDKDFKIHSIRAFLDCDGAFTQQKIDDCTNKFKELEKKLQNVFINIKKFGPIKGDLIDDKTGNSYSEMIYYELENGYIILEHKKWSNSMDYIDSVSLSIETNEVRNWIDSGYF
jgi:hypothetical protein